MEGVPIVAPAVQNQPGDMLIRNVDFVVRKSNHTIITGPNGVGKTATARIIAGLWPLYRGLLSKPNRKDIIYIPQRAYLSTGTLRDQFIYPASHANMVEDRRSDEDLMQILHKVRLEYLVDREGGWETVKEWKDVLSGGEKQRVGIARVLYHMPQFAVLDDATSAVSADIEALMYENLLAEGISKPPFSVLANIANDHSNSHDIT